MDECGYNWIGRNKDFVSRQPNPSRTKCWRAYVALHIRDSPGGERRTRRRTRGRGTQIPNPETSVLCIGGPYTMQISIPTLSEDSVCGLHGIPEAVALLSRVFDHGGIRSTTQWHHK